MSSPRHVYVASKDDLYDAVLEAVQEVLPHVAENLEAPGSSEEPQPDPWLSNREASKYLDLSKSTLQRHREQEVLPYSKLEGKIYYRRSDLDAVLEANRVSASDDAQKSRS